METFLAKARQLGELRLFDLQFARHMMDVNGEKVPELLLAAALASNRISHGDTCLSLDSVKTSSLYTNSDLRTVRQKLPTLEKWRDVLLKQKVVCAAPEIAQTSESVSDGNDPTEPGSAGNEQPDTVDSYPQLSPLVLDENNRLYLARYWTLEQSLSRSINRLLDCEPVKVNSEKLKDTLARLFGAADSGPDWQKASVANAVLSQFCVITGGPGTGKTYTVTALLAALLDQGVEPRKIALAAPTGKASTRLTQSIQKDLSALLKKLSLPEVTFESVTLHKFLGAIPGRVRPRHNADNPMLYDVVIIDEASMIDLPMMARTFEALAPEARIVLIGDKNQLHSVESGMVLGDICGGRTRAQLSAERCASLAKVGVGGLPDGVKRADDRIADCIVYLEKSHRVRDDGSISKLANAVNGGDVDTALQLLGNKKQENLSLIPQQPAHLEQVLREYVLPACRKYTDSTTPQEALENMSDTGVLCALRRGLTGSVRVNALVEKLLRDDGAIEQGENYYHGRPLMITENSSHQRLYNGDHGLVFFDKDNNTSSVYFAADSGAVDNAADYIRKISHSRLPQHETFYAMTVHKSQGSEYATVVVVLPDADSPILGRELLYTAITRARSRVIIVANQEQLEASIERRSVRQSGLRELLWSEPAPPLPANTQSSIVQPDVVANANAQVQKKKQSLKPQQQELDF